MLCRRGVCEQGARNGALFTGVWHGAVSVGGGYEQEIGVGLVVHADVALSAV